LEEDKSNSVFSDLKDEIISYLELRAELTKISSYEIISKLGASIVSALALVIFIFFFLFFLFLSLGFYFAKVFDSFYYGFGLVAGFYLFLLLVFIIIKKKFIEKPIMNKIIESLTASHESKN